MSSHLRPPQAFSLPSDIVHSTKSRSTAGSHHHCFLDFHAFIASPCAPGETAELYFSLFNRTENRFLTEEFCLILNHLGAPFRDPEQRLGRLRTLFTDLKPEDVGPSIFLICRIIRNGALKMRTEAGQRSNRTNGQASRTIPDNGTVRSNVPVVDSPTAESFSFASDFGRQTTNASVMTTASLVGGRPTFRRPIGCAVMELPQLSKLTNDGSGEHTMQIFAPRNEGTFATLHEDIIHGRTKDVATASR